MAERSDISYFDFCCEASLRAFSFAPPFLFKIKHKLAILENSLLENLPAVLANMSCENCLGSALDDCARCGGDGVVECPQCGGMGDMACQATVNFGTFQQNKIN